MATSRTNDSKAKYGYATDGAGETRTPMKCKYNLKYNKVNRCLARYSPRATTTNRPTNRAPKKPAWPGPN